MGEGGRKGKGPKEFPLPRPWGRDLCKQNASLTVVPGEGGAQGPPRFPARPMTRMESSTVLADFRGEPESDNCSPPWEVLSGLRGVFETSWCGGQPACPRAGPSRASLGVTVVAMGQPAVQQTSAAAACSVYISALVLPLNGGKQTFWEGIQHYEFTECQAFGANRNQFGLFLGFRSFAPCCLPVT